MLTKNNLFISRLENFILGTLLFLFPTQLAFHFWPESAFVFGIRVDYLSPAIYLTDLLILILLGFWIVGRKLNFISLIKKHRKLFYIFILVAVANIIFSMFPQISFFRWIKYLEFLFFALYLSSKESYSVKPLYYSAIFFSLIGILQFSISRTLGGVMYIFGERLFNAGTPGIALFSINGREFLRAYSTFSHPNSMAGYLGVLAIFLLLSKNIKKLNYKYLGFGIIFLGITLTFSVSAFVAAASSLLIFAAIKKYQPKFNLNVYILGFAILFSVLQVLMGGMTFPNKYFSYERVSERLKLANIAGQMITQSPIKGAGLNTFIPNLPNFQVNGNSIWLLQPVHNIFLLIFSETGILGLIIFVGLLYLMLRKSSQRKEYYLLIPLIFIIVTGTTDHYWLTIQQNNLLLTLLISHFI